MKKHRIVKISDCYSTYFIIEYKFLFWWFAYKKEHLDWNVLVNEEVHFDTFEEAKKMVEVLECCGHRKREVVTEFEK